MYDGMVVAVILLALCCANGATKLDVGLMMRMSQKGKGPKGEARALAY